MASPRFPLLRAFLIACLLLTAAGGREARGAAAEEAVTTLQFWNQLSFEPQRTVIQELTDQFNAEHPTIHVEVLHSWQLQQKLLTAVAGNVPPDVVIFDRFRLPSYAHRGAVRPLDDLVPQFDVERDDFYPVAWEECVYQGELYGIPFNTDVRVLYYNKDVFRRFGLDPERPPRTWQEVREYSEKMTTFSEDGRLETIGYVPYSNFGNTWLYLFGWQKGAEFISEDGRTALLDSPELLAALEWINDFVEFYGVENLRFFQTSSGSQELDSFMIGRMGMSGEEVYMLARINRYAPDMDFGIAPLPYPEDGQRATWSGGFAMIVPRGSANAEEAMQFIEFMTSAEQQQYFGEKGFQIPANREAVEASDFYDTPEWQALINELPYSNYRPASPAGAILWDELSRAWEQGGGGTVEPEVALARAQANVQSELDRIFRERSYPLVNWGLPVALLSLLFFGLLAVRGYFSARQIRTLTVHKSEAYWGYIFALPVIIGLLAFTLGPIVASAVLSFCNYDVLNPARWVGMGNYERMFFDDPYVAKSLWNTAYYTVLAVPTSVFGSLGLALLLNQPVAGRSVWRTLFYLPSIVPIVALSLLFLWLFNGEYGLFNIILGAIGLPRINWLTSATWAKPSLVLMNMWTIGAGMIIFLAALQGVPRHLYESAVIDGAGVLTRFRAVTFPMISPAVFFLCVMNTITALQIFAQAFLMTRGTGEPEDSTLFYVFYLFRIGFEQFNMGYAAALAWMIFLLILVITIIQFRLSKRWVYSEAD